MDGLLEPRGLAILVGIQDYADPACSLRAPRNDVQQLASLLEHDHGYEVHTVLDRDATRDRLEALFSTELRARAQDRQLLIFFAGHGVAHETGEGMRGFLLPYEATAEALYPMDELTLAIERCGSRQTLLILDCCFAGAVRWSSSRNLPPTEAPPMSTERYDRYRRESTWQILTSAAHDETATDIPRIEHGGVTLCVPPHSPFFKHLYDGLGGAADLAIGGDVPDGVITGTELYVFLRDKLERDPDCARQTPGLWRPHLADNGEFVFRTPRTPLRLATVETLAKDDGRRRSMDVALDAAKRAAVPGWRFAAIVAVIAGAMIALYQCRADGLARASDVRRNLPDHVDGRAATFSADGSRFAYAGAHGDVYWYELPDGAVHELPGTDAIEHLAFTASGEVLAISHSDGQITMYELDETDP